MKDLGYQNGWEGVVRILNDGTRIREPDRNPAEYDKCRSLGHRLREVNVGRCLYKLTCDICQITFWVDSSD
jgi:hypothetical protein